MKHIDKQLHKIENTDIKYWNGIKWLVREFCETKKEAKDKMKELKEQRDIEEKNV